MKRATRCRDVEHRLESILAGTLPPVETRAVDDHLATCSACQELLALARIAGDPVSASAALPPSLPPAPSTLVAAVLERTTGAVCAQAAERLAGAERPLLLVREDAILAEHLAHCANCSDLVRLLAALHEELPGLAEARLDARFTYDVLRATSRRPRVSRWQRWVLRPRFALEVAYAGMLLCLLLVAPGAPLQALPNQLLTVGRELPQELPRHLELPARLDDVPLPAPLAELPQVRRKVGESVGRRLEVARTRGEGLVASLRHEVGTYWDAAASLLASGNDSPPAPPPEETR